MNSCADTMTGTRKSQVTCPDMLVWSMRLCPSSPAGQQEASAGNDG
ncbi:hypothetical protein [Methanogenium sp. MK-MG]|nr:hypothetical protein [Methanogenium sp. MK-MG]